MALSVEDAEQLLAAAQGRAAAHPELDDLQEIIIRVAAQVQWAPGRTRPYLRGIEVR